MDRLFFFGTKVMPLMFGAAALHLAYTNYMYPLSEEELARINELRSRKKPKQGTHKKGLEQSSLSSAFDEVFGKKESDQVVSQKSDHGGLSTGDDKLNAN